MIIFALCQYALLEYVEDCYDSSDITIVIKQSQVQLSLRPFNNINCYKFQKDVEFELVVITLTNTQKVFKSRSKFFNYTHTNQFIFTTSSSLDDVIRASVIMKSMTHFTSINIGAISIDQKIPEDCFASAVLDFSNNQTIITIQPTNYCDYLASGNIVSASIPVLNIQKFPHQDNDSIFLSGYSDLKSTLKIQFSQKISYWLLKIKIQTLISYQFQVEIDEINYLLMGKITQISGYDFAPFGEHFKLINMYSQFAIVFLQVSSVFEELKQIKVTSVEVQLSTDNSSDYWFNSYTSIGQIGRNITFPNPFAKLISEQKINKFYLDLVGVQMTTMVYFIQIEIFDYQDSSFQTVLVDFLNNKLRMSIKQVSVTRKTSLKQQDVTSMYFTSQSIDDDVYEIFVESFPISPTTEYISILCVQYECLQIRQMYKENKVVKTNLDFLRESEQTPFDVYQNFYVITNGNDIRYSIFIMSLWMIVCTFWGVLQMYLENRKHKNKRKLRKFAQEDEI